MPERFRRPVGLLALLAAIGWGAWSVARDRDQLAVALARLDVWVLVLSFVLSCLGVLATAVAWHRWLAGLGVAMPLAPAVRLFLVTQTGKYLPGAVWPFVAQAAAGRAYGASATTFPLGTGLLLYSHVATGLVVAGLGLGLTGGPWWSWVLLLGGAVGLVPAWAGWLVRRLHRGSAGFDGRGIWGSHALVVLAWGCYGLATWVLVDAIATQPVPVPRVIGAFALSWVVGLLVVIAPAGAGPREAVLVALLAGSMTGPDALGLALVSRVLMTVADLALAGVAAVALPRPATAQAQDG